ncbi:MAG: DUF5309 family protein [Rhodocyclaceae bacterium]|nr:DUF5309 family protein [Rhodocyclaceae bacterium]
MAETVTGTAYSTNLTVETPIDIDDMIYVLSPKDLPLLFGVNSDGLPLLPSAPTGDTTYYWLEEDVLLPRGTLNEALDDTETGIDVATGDGAKFRVGDAIRIEDEIMTVTAVATDTLTVTRGTAGTAAATHVTGLEVVGLGSYVAEGSIVTNNMKGRDKYSNYTQIHSAKLSMSRTEQGIRKYGVPVELARQTMNNMQHFMQSQEQNVLYGVKAMSSTLRMSGGLDHFITTNEDSTSEWLTVDVVEAMQQAAYDEGGMWDVLMAQPKAFGALNNTLGQERIQTVTVDDPRRGRQPATRVITEFGEVTLHRHRWVRKTDAFGIKRGNIVRRVFQPTIMQPLAKTDDTDSFMVVGEFGLLVKGQAHMCKFSGLDTSAAMPADLV